MTQMKFYVMLNLLHLHSSCTCPLGRLRLVTAHKFSEAGMLGGAAIITDAARAWKSWSLY